MAKRRKLNPNRFQKNDAQALFAFDPIRKNLIKWGAIAGGLGGIFMAQQAIIWQVIGVAAVVFISNYHINQAAKQIPRWHAVVNSFSGVTVALFGTIILATIIITFLNA